LTAAALLSGVLVAWSALAQSPGNFSTLSTTGTATLNGDVMACSGHPWIDVRCPSMAGGAIGDGSHDDTGAIQTTINTAVTNNWPVHVPAGTYKVTAKLTIDYAGEASNGFRLISEGATIDGRSIAAGPVLQVQCSGGTPSSPANCFYFKEEGTLFVNANTPGYAAVIGKPDFSDAHNSAKLDHLVVNNASTNAAAGGCQFNYLLDSDLWAVCVSAGGAGGMALEQTVFSRISGAGTAQGTGGRGLLIENGYNYANTIFGIDLEVSPTCLSVTTTHDGENTFISPYFNCVTAVNATGSVKNMLVNPLYGGGVVSYGPNSTGIRVIGGTGNRQTWLYPAAATYIAAPIDEGMTISSSNAPGASLTVTLPAPAALTAGWSISLTTDNNKGMTIAPSGGLILAGNKTFTTLSLGPGNYEYVRLEYDGSNFRALGITRATQMAAGASISRDFPGNWLFPATAGYSATMGDNGSVLSSFNTAAGLTVTLPSLPTPAALPSGWSLAVTAENGKSLTVQVNGVSGGQILYPKVAPAGVSSIALPMSNYEFIVLQYDGNGNFRVEQATPGTATQLGMSGVGGISRWSFPAVSAYAATLADNGNAISAFNSPLAFLTVTLPPTTAISAGWTIQLANDNGKLAAVQVNATNGGKIVYPGSAATVTSLQLAGGDYETAVLQFDGSNFRVMHLTPASAATIGVTGGTCNAKWNFPAVSSFTAGPSDCGSVISNFNTPTSSLAVTLPPTTAIAAGWSMSFASDNNKALIVQVNGTSGGTILIPGTRGAQAALTLYGGNYELVRLEFDGSNFRIRSTTPATASANGMFPATGTPASSSAACQAGQIQFDANYLYACTASNTWKRSAWSSF
jgi:hypothetical protein